VPYEHQYQMIADGFENTSRDFAKWAEFLNLRADIVGQPHFAGAKYDRPKPKPYPATNVSLQAAAASLADIADCQVAMLNSVSKALVGLVPPLAPAKPDPAETTLGKALTASELLHLILSWQQLDIGIFKAFMRVYGLVHENPPLAPHPGPGKDDRLAKVISSRLNVIQTDANNFVIAQKFAKPAPTALFFPAANNDHDALVNLEQQYHRLVDNYLLVLTVLPFHLFVATP
jgi:hypothetical protein